MPQIEKEYVDSGKMKHVFMDFPLDMHKDAFKASEAGLCAGDQGKFWEMHDKLFANPQVLKPDNLTRHAEALGLDMVKFNQCLGGGMHASEIRKSVAEGQKAGITGTPAFLLGLAEPNGKVKAVKKIVGAQPYSSFKSEIDEILKKK